MSQGATTSSGIANQKEQQNSKTVKKNNKQEAEGSGSIKNKVLPIIGKILNYNKATIVILMCFFVMPIMILFKSFAPEGEADRRISNISIGLDNVFHFDTSQVASFGSSSESPYSDSGQGAEWIDTGFVTTGERLQIYANGAWYPWGKVLTKKKFSYGYEFQSDPSNTAKGSKPNYTNVLVAKEQYAECSLNTSLDGDSEIADQNVSVSTVQYNRYTSANSNNNTLDPEIKADQADCVKGYNCSVATTESDPDYVKGYDEVCAMKRGAGIYLKIGQSSEYAYHIINHLIPKIERKCSSINGEISCIYNYAIDQNNELIKVQVPFSLPAAVYNKDLKLGVSSYDIRSENNQFIGAINYGFGSQYFYTTYEKNTAHEGLCNIADGETQENGYENILGKCYKSVKKIYPAQTATTKNTALCPQNNDYSDSSSIHPDELCPPKPNQPLYLKVSDTTYTDNDGTVDIIFASGAKKLIPDTPKGVAGPDFSFIQDIIAVLLSPLWGKQIDLSIKDNTSIVYSADSILLSVIDTDEGRAISGGVRFYVSQNNEDLYVTLISKRSYQGILISIPSLPSTFVSKYLDVKFRDSVDRRNIIITVKDAYKDSIDISSVKTQYINKRDYGLININNMQDGLIVKIRNLILKSPTFQTMRMISVVIFIMTMGFGIIRGEKGINVRGMQTDWMRFMVGLWATDPLNYQLIDDFLLPIMFKGIFSISSILLQGAADIMGTSMDINSPFDFFNNIIKIALSRELFIKVFALNYSSPILFVFSFVLIYGGVIRLVVEIVRGVGLIAITTINIGGMVIFFPLFGLLSMFDKFKSMLDNWIEKMKTEFLNLALSIGIFGIFIGIVYYFLKQALDFSVYWDSIFSATIIPFIWKIEIFHWKVETDRSSVSTLLYLTVFYFTTFAIGKMNELANQIATNLVGSGGLGMNMANASAIFDTIFGTLSSLGSSAYDKVFSESSNNDAEPKPKPTPPINSGDGSQPRPSGTRDVNNKQIAKEISKNEKNMANNNKLIAGRQAMNNKIAENIARKNADIKDSANNRPFFGGTQEGLTFGNQHTSGGNQGGKTQSPSRLAFGRPGENSKQGNQSRGVEFNMPEKSGLTALQQQNEPRYYDPKSDSRYKDNQEVISRLQNSNDSLQNRNDTLLEHQTPGISDQNMPNASLNAPTIEQPQTQLSAPGQQKVAEQPNVGANPQKTEIKKAIQKHNDAAERIDKLDKVMDEVKEQKQQKAIEGDAFSVIKKNKS